MEGKQIQSQAWSDQILLYIELIDEHEESLSADVCTVARTSYLMQLELSEALHPSLPSTQLLSAHVNGVQLDPSIPIGPNLDCILQGNEGAAKNLPILRLKPCKGNVPLAFQLSAPASRDTALHSLKQSLALRYGDPTLLSKLAPAEQDAIVKGMKLGDGNALFQIHRRCDELAGGKLKAIGLRMLYKTKIETGESIAYRQLSVPAEAGDHSVMDTCRRAGVTEATAPLCIHGLRLPEEYNLIVSETIQLVAADGFCYATSGL